jgi:FtsH-binding integral membrane protein
VSRVGILGAPRPMPHQRWLAPVAGAVVIALALPLFLVAGWPLSGWAVAALLWVGVQAFGLLLARVKPSPDNVAASGALAFGMMARLLVVLVVLLALAASNRDAGLAAALTYGAAYTAELGLSLFGYYAQEPRA